MEHNQHLLIIGLVWPEPDSSAAGQRMLQLIQLFLDSGMQVTFACQASDSEYMFDLKQLGVDRIRIRVNDSGFDNLIRKLNPDVVLFDRYVMEEQFGWRVAEQCPTAIRVLDSEDLHCLRAARAKAVKAGQIFGEADLLEEEVSKREIASIYRCDLTLIISQAEMELLTRVFKIDAGLLYYIPLSVATSGLPALPSFEDRVDFVFIGNFLHDPNADAVDYLKSVLWPLIRQRLRNVSLHIYGAYPSNKALQYHKPSEGFYVHGRASSASEVMLDAKVLLAPLRFGAGLKGKLIEALLYGTPSVTTAVGAEGIAASLPWNGFIVEEPEAFADAAVKLYTNAVLWQQMQQNGLQILQQRFSGDNEKALLLKITQVRRELQLHRRRNFIGSMLLHHTAASTKYMSKWIEAKNK